MLHIFLAILKIVFVLVAIVLLLALAVLLLLLLVPVRYRASMEKSREFTALAQIHWLLHFLSVRASYREKEVQLTVKILGITLTGKETEEKRSGPKKRERQADIPKRERQERQADIPKPETKQTDMPARAEKQNARKEPPDKKAPRKGKESGRKKQTFFQKLRALIEKIKNSFYRFLEKIQAIRDSAADLKERIQNDLDFWHDPHTQHSYLHIKKELRRLFKHYLPQKLNGRLRVGFQDPAVTGEAVGLLCMAQVFTGANLQIEADFERPVLEGKLYLKGHVRALHAVRSLLSLLADPHCRAAFRRLQKLRVP